MDLEPVRQEGPAAVRARLQDLRLEELRCCGIAGGRLWSWPPVLALKSQSAGALVDLQGGGAKLKTAQVTDWQRTC